ncbi:MAG TPA: hypothetical protein DCY07_09025 [Rhodospirillaceae bacterium]|nr:hypothetical protein [Rhodospirillaceae bacterium]
MSNEDSEKGMQGHMVAQWITSLAVSIICCAVLFIIFAGYIVQLHDETNLLSLKVSLLDDRNGRLAAEIDFLRRGPSVQINTIAPQSVSVSPAENLVNDGTAATTPASASEQPPAQPQEKTDIVLPMDDASIPDAPADVIVPAAPTPAPAKDKAAKPKT